MFWLSGKIKPQKETRIEPIQTKQQYNLSSSFYSPFA